MRLMAARTDVRRTSAPSSCAFRHGGTIRCVIEDAGDEDALLREQHGVPSRRDGRCRQSGVLEWRRRGWSSRLVRGLRARTQQPRRVSLGAITAIDQAEFGGAVRVGEHALVLGEQARASSSAGVGASGRSRRPWMICTPGGPPITAISAVGHLTQRSFPMPRIHDDVCAPVRLAHHDAAAGPSPRSMRARVRRRGGSSRAIRGRGRARSRACRRT